MACTYKDLYEDKGGNNCKNSCGSKDTEGEKARFPAKNKNFASEIPGKTDRCLPKDVSFPGEFDLTFTKNHWSNKEKALQHLTKVVEKKKAELNLPAEQMSLLIFDVFKGQKTQRYQNHLESNGCALVYIPANLTDQFQPLDITVNGSTKEFLKKVCERNLIPN
eukprot:gene11049-19900_t